MYVAAASGHEHDAPRRGRRSAPGGSPSPGSSAILTVTPLVRSSARTTAVGAGAPTGAIAIVPALIDRPNSRPSRVIRMIGKSERPEERDPAAERHLQLRPRSSARKRPKLIPGTPGR